MSYPVPVTGLVRGAAQFGLAYGPRQLTPAIKSDIRTLNFGSDVIFAPP